MAQAALASDAILADSYPTEEQITRWRTLFSYTRLEALTLISAQRSDLTRPRISDAHWELVRAEQEVAGHDRETYEHAQNLATILASQSASIPSGDGMMMFLIRLGGLLDSAEKVREICAMDSAPRVVVGSSESGSGRKVQFCVVDGDAKKRIEEWLVGIGKGVGA